VVAKKVEAAFDPADERLVWMLLQLERAQYLITTFTAPRMLQQRRKPAAKLLADTVVPPTLPKSGIRRRNQVATNDQCKRVTRHEWMTERHQPDATPSHTRGTGRNGALTIAANRPQPNACLAERAMRNARAETAIDGTDHAPLSRTMVVIVKDGGKTDITAIHGLIPSTPREPVHSC